MLFTILKNIKFSGRLDITNHRGKVFQFGTGKDLSKVRLTNKSIEYKIFRNPGMYLGEGYMNKEIVVEEGTLDNFLKIITSAYNDYISHNLVFKTYENIYSYLKPFHQLNKIIQSKKNVAHHYDINEEMYKLFLDSDMQYSCAYFHNKDVSLEQAQKDKKKTYYRKITDKRKYVCH